MTDVWYSNIVNGEEWFSEGHAMFVGKKKGAIALKAGSFARLVEEAHKRRLEPTTRVRDEIRGEHPAVMNCVVLRGGTVIQRRFYDYTTKHKMSLYLGAKFDGGTSNCDRYVVCKIGDKLVGMIAPVRA